MSQVQIDFSKIVAQDVSGSARSRTISLPSTSDFASLIDAGHDAAPAPPRAEARTAKSSRHDDASSSRRADSAAPPERRMSTRLERADAPANAQDVSRPRITDRIAGATDADNTFVSRQAADRAADGDQGANKTDSGDDDTAAAAAALAAVPASAVAAAVQPGGLALDGAATNGATTSSSTADGASADGGARLDAAAAAVTMLSAVPPGIAGAAGTADGEEQAPATDAARSASATLLAVLAQKKPGDVAATKDAEPEAAKTGAEAEAAPADSALAGKTEKIRVDSAASATAPEGETSDGNEQQALAVAADPPEAAEHLAKEAAQEAALAHAEGATAKSENKDSADEAVTLRADELRAGAMPATAQAPLATSPGALAQAGAGAIAGVSAGVHSATAAAAGSGGVDAPAATVALPDLAVAIASHGKAGHRSFDIRLDPAELGHIHVRLDVDRDGNVMSRLIVDRAETLDLLRRDAPQLERALQDAGLKADAQTMQFSLRDQNAGQQNGQHAPRAAARPADPDAASRLDEVPLNYGRPSGRTGGVDIRI